MRSRSDDAVISRPPSLPMAITLNAPPSIWPEAATSSASTTGSNPAITASAMFANAGPASSAFATPSTICAPEDLFLGDTAGRIERALEIARRPKLGRKRFVELSARRQLAEESGIDQRVQRGRRARQMGGDARRGTSDLRDQPQQLWVGVQHRKQLHTGGQSAQEAVELRECSVGIGGLGKRFEQRGHQLRQQLAGSRAAHGTHAPMVPAANGGGDMTRVLEAEFRQGFERFGIFLDAREHQ